MEYLVIMTTHAGQPPTRPAAGYRQRGWAVVASSLSIEPSQGRIWSRWPATSPTRRRPTGSRMRPSGGSGASTPWSTTPACSCPRLHHARTYLLVAVLAVVAALMGLAFKAILYQTGDLCDRLWHGRPEKATAGQYVLWFLILLAFGKIAACSLTIGAGAGQPAEEETTRRT
jgi:hypothetical protein